MKGAELIMKKQLISLALAGAMMVTTGCAGAETVKSERVFAVMDAAGTQTTVIDNVHIKNEDALDTITDRTSLTGVENMAGHETFTLDGETLTWKAAGNDITYQGKSDKEVAVKPVVTVKVDGKEVSADTLKDVSGEVELTVSYTTSAPYVAVSILPLPEDGVSDIEVENAMLLTEGSRQVVVGYAMPGLDEKLELPDHFTVKAKADHAEISWMMTLATAEPIDVLCDEVGDDVKDLTELKDQAVSLLTALSEGKDLPEMDGDWKTVTDTLTELNDGVSQLVTGAQALKDGADQLTEGIASLEDGLTTLTANNDTLNAAASQLFDAVLATANQQLASAGLDQAGITLPELTQENYAEALQTVLDALNPDTLRAAATEQARAKVEQAVQAKESAVREAVEPVVESKVLEAVLQAVGLNMSAEDYQKAVKAGQVTAEQEKQIAAAVKQQMATDEVKAQIDAAVQEQMEALVEQNLQSEDVQNQIETAIAPAQAGYEQISSLKTQLDSVNAFVTGLNTYTSGVSQAADGATQLHDGATTLADGASQLAEGTVTLQTGLTDGAKEMADKLLPYCTDDLADALRIYNETADGAAEAGHYDLVADDMTATTVYIIRTDMK